MVDATSIAVGGAEPVVMSRMTRGGSCLWYQLEVIQQPERARACGAGPKSSADRRPVDPPPVVQLRIFEGSAFDQAKDITFNYNANFFLFATLEHARVLAHGRVQTPSAASPPVLTGLPVSGMAYLDRPKEAGYFLFPDLSVRHEGRYRLTFNLYEQTKDFADLDKDTYENSATHTAESFDWRMEVKSNDFMVYSAKRFPGLTESTALSRTVAEQGCRVRIRRDVRMRRREGKSSTAAPVPGNSDPHADGEYARRHRTQTPEVVADYRARSRSTDGAVGTQFAHDAAHPQRRPSVSDYQDSAARSAQNAHHVPSPQTDFSMPASFSANPGNPGGGPVSTYAHLRYIGNQTDSFAQPAPPSAMPPAPMTCCAPPHSYPQPPQPPLSHAPHRPQPSFSTPSPAPPNVAPSMQPSHPPYSDRPTSLNYAVGPHPAPAPAPPPKRESFSSTSDHHRRMSSNYVLPAAIEPAVDQCSNPRSVPATTAPAETKNFKLPSLSEMMGFQSDNQLAVDSKLTPSNSEQAPSLSRLLLPNTAPHQPPAPAPSGPTQFKKRSYGQYTTMDYPLEASDTSTPVKNHARQIDPPREFERGKLWWKRADGTLSTARGEHFR
ncbi:hypothetical protein SEPCBS119000_001367 [Sporothrix epigloea]|uniref:Velvet domain-containing protein n=1 Tax=Sporothrix epigloea TaxID=1892477 RepID=A0ABP0DBT9_9PEZI